jgi:hypothetical protein
MTSSRIEMFFHDYTEAQEQLSGPGKWPAYVIYKVIIIPIWKSYFYMYTYWEQQLHLKALEITPTTEAFCN